MKDNRLLEMRVFKAVAEAGGFTVAAESLGISQPYATRLVTELERRLGITLIHRTTRGQRLSEEGQQFLADCTRLLHELEQVEARVAAPTAQHSGLLRVSLPLVFGVDQIVPRLPAFLAAHPGIRLQLSLADTVSNLIDDEVDVAVRMGRLEDSSLVARRLCELRRLVVAAPAYLERRGGPHKPADLREHDCLLWQGPLDHLNVWPFLVEGQREDIAMRGTVSSTSGMALMTLLHAGAGISRLGEHIALPAIRAGKLVPLLREYEFHPDLSIHAVFRRERQVPPRIRAFVDYLVNILAEPSWRSGSQA
jgi:DNA-binding transcriptional LysR family regulator